VQLFLPPALLTKSNLSESTTTENPEVQQSKSVDPNSDDGLMDELANTLATALTLSPTLSPTSPTTESLLLTNLIPTSLIPPALTISSPQASDSDRRQPISSESANSNSEASNSAPSNDSATTITTTSEEKHELTSLELGDAPELAAFSPALSTHHLLSKNRRPLRLGNVDVDYNKTTVEDLKKKLHDLAVLSSVVLC
jgi:hypothetical protein